MAEYEVRETGPEYGMKSPEMLRKSFQHAFSL